MKRETSFETPLVLQVAEIQLDTNLLQGASSLGSILATGHGVEELDESTLNDVWD